MSILCPTCRKPLPDDQLHWPSRMGNCRMCHATFPLPAEASPAPEGLLAGGAVTSPGGASIPIGTRRGGFAEVAGPLQRGNIPAPPTMTADREADDLVLRRSWRQPHATWLLLGALVLLAIAGPLLYFGIPTAWADPGVWSKLWLVIPGLFLIGGIRSLYFAMVSLINTTTIRVTRTELAVSHGPLPWSAPLHLARADTAQLYCVEQTMHFRRAGVYFAYDVEALLRNGDRRPLVTGLPELAQALFLEQEIERHWQIEDALVLGEVRRE